MNLKGGKRDERGGRDEARVINFIFVFLLPPLRLNTIIQSRKVASFVCPFNACCSPGGRKYKDSNELQRELLKHKRADRDTLGRCSAQPASLGSSALRRERHVDHQLTAHQPSHSASVWLSPPRFVSSSVSSISTSLSLFIPPYPPFIFSSLPFLWCSVKPGRSWLG